MWVLDGFGHPTMKLRICRIPKNWPKSQAGGTFDSTAGDGTGAVGGGLWPAEQGERQGHVGGQKCGKSAEKCGLEEDCPIHFLGGHW